MRYLLVWLFRVFEEIWARYCTGKKKVVSLPSFSFSHKIR